MDDQHPPRSASSSARWPHEDTPALPLGFVPLGLILLPSGTRVDLVKPDTLVGRHSSADVRLPLPDVSRQHCRFLFQQSAWHVVDLDSMNGVFVNNKRVQRTALRHGDRIRIGGFIFQVEMAAAHTGDTSKVDKQAGTLRKEQRRAS